jgi:hypothetical protein
MLIMCSDTADPLLAALTCSAVSNIVISQSFCLGLLGNTTSLGPFTCGILRVSYQCLFCSKVIISIFSSVPQGLIVSAALFAITI